jgi:hypothetical protein
MTQERYGKLTALDFQFERLKANKKGESDEYVDEASRGHYFCECVLSMANQEQEIVPTVAPPQVEAPSTRPEPRIPDVYVQLTPV